MAQAHGFQGISVPATSPQVILPVQPGSNVYVVPNPREKYKLVLFKLGVAEIVLGSLSCLLAFILMGVHSTYHLGINSVSPGIWCPAFIIASGILGVKTKKHSSVCMYNANMSLSILASVFMGVLVISSGIAAAVGYYAQALQGILAAIAFIGMVVSIIHSAYCCAGVCCDGHKGYQGNVMYMPQNQFMQQPQQVIQPANGQLVLVQAQPMMAPPNPVTSIPITRSQTTYQPVANQQLISVPSTSTGAQPAQITNEQKSLMQGAIESPPGYSLHPQQE